MLLGLIAGILELFTDAAGHQFARSLFYPQDQPLLWDSPFYMPLSWMIVLTQLGYLAWRLAGLRQEASSLARHLAGGAGGRGQRAVLRGGRLPRGLVALCAHCLHLGHTPVYVLLFEGLVAAALPLLTLGLLRLRWPMVAARGAILGLWMPCAALLAWLRLACGRLNGDNTKGKVTHDHGDDGATSARADVRANRRSVGRDLRAGGMRADAATQGTHRPCWTPTDPAQEEPIGT